MRPSSVPTAARAAAVVLAVLAAFAAFNTAYVVAYAVDDGDAALIGASAVSAGVTAALGIAARRLWRRGNAG